MRNYPSLITQPYKVTTNILAYIPLLAIRQEIPITQDYCKDK